jgi:cobalt-zinc-cadmium efflux system outer membrane protein
MLSTEYFGRRRMFALLSCLIGSLAADAADLTLREVIALTQERNPQLAAFSFQSEATRQQSVSRSFSPAASVDVQLENFAGSGDLAAARALETTLQVSKVIELGGKARVRSELGTAELDGVDAQQRRTRADVIAEAARRFLHVLSDQAHLEVTRRATQLFEQARDVVQARIREGAISPVFLNRAEIALARAEIAQEHAEHELAASRVALAIMWADTDAQFDRVAGDLFSFPTIEALEAYSTRLDASPELLKFASEQRVLEARQRLADAQRKPNVTVTAGVRRLEGFDDQALVAGFSIPIGTRRRAEPEIRSARAESEQLRLSTSARRLELHALLFSLYQEISHARTEANALHTDIRPQAENMVETTAEGYRLGRYSLVELIDAQRALIEIEQDSIRAALEFHTNLIEIERATGVAVHTLATR